MLRGERQWASLRERGRSLRRAAKSGAVSPAGKFRTSGDAIAAVGTMPRVSICPGTGRDG